MRLHKYLSGRLAELSLDAGDLEDFVDQLMSDRDYYKNKLSDAELEITKLKAELADANRNATYTN